LVATGLISAKSRQQNFGSKAVKSRFFAEFVRKPKFLDKSNIYIENKSSKQTAQILLEAVSKSQVLGQPHLTKKFSLV
jgi:hypothetical protein